MGDPEQNSDSESARFRAGDLALLIDRKGRRYMLTLSGEVARTYDENGETRVDLELTCTKQDGAIAVQGWATFVVPA